MGEFDWGTYTEGGGGEFIGRAEMDALVASGETFFVTSIREGRSARYNTDQWLVDFINAREEEKTKSFNKGNAERDGRMTRVKETIEATGEPMAARFVRVGNRNDITGA